MVNALAAILLVIIVPMVPLGMIAMRYPPEDE